MAVNPLCAWQYPLGFDRRGYSLSDVPRWCAVCQQVGLCHSTESSFGVIMLLSGTALVKEKPLPCLCQTLSVPWLQMWWKNRVEQQHTGCCCRSWLLHYFILFVYVFFKNTSNLICCLNPLDLFHISIWERNFWEGDAPPPKKKKKTWKATWQTFCICISHSKPTNQLPFRPPIKPKLFSSLRKAFNAVH